MNENIKELVSKNLILAFGQIRTMVKNNNEKSNTLRLIEADYYQLKSQELQNIISFENANLKKSQIRKRTLDLIDSLRDLNSQYDLIDFSDVLEYPEKFIKSFQNYANNFSNAIDKLDFLKRMISFLPLFATESTKYNMDRKTDMFNSMIKESNIKLKLEFIQAKKNCDVLLDQIGKVSKMNKTHVIVSDQEIDFGLVVEKLKFLYNEIYNIAATGIEAIEIEKHNFSNRVNSVTRNNVKRILKSFDDVNELFIDIRNYLEYFINQLNSATYKA